MRVAPGIIVALLAVLSIAREVDGQASPMSSDGLDSVRFAASLGVDLSASQRTPSGARWRELVVGTGNAPGAVYFGTVRLSMFTPEGGRVGADSVDSFTVKIGYSILMPGIDEAMVGMRVGTRRQIVLPLSAQGNAGQEGMPGVPRGSPLVINVELLRISDRADP